MTMPTDPYKYFRIEARELLEELGSGVLELERSPSGPELVARLLRAAHTFKGASRVVKQNEIADLAHAVEDVLAPHRTGDTPVPPDRIQKLLELLDAVKSRLQTLSPAPPQRSTAGPGDGVEERFQTVRVEALEMDRLLGGVAQASVQLAVVRNELQLLEQTEAVGGAIVARLEAIERSGGPRETLRGLLPLAEELQAALKLHRRGICAALDQIDREVGDVRDTAGSLSLQPVAAIFTSLERAVRDAAQTLGKAVEFRADGGAARLEGRVLSPLQDALLHIVRNAVAHGIEPEQDRVARGKPRVGRVELSVVRAGNRIVLTCTDDGRGVDPDAVRRAAAARGLLPESQLAAFTPDQLAQLILKGGLSTSVVPTEVSGRGVGLDVVRDTVARLQGELSMRTLPGRGTTFELRVPFSLSSISALQVEAAGITCCIPLDAVTAALRVGHEEIARAADGASIMYKGASIPFLPLGAALGQPPSVTEKRCSAVVVEAGGATAAIGVDRIRQTGSILVKPLPRWATAGPCVAGASPGPAGDVWLVLDPQALAAAAAAVNWKTEQATPARPPVLVVDDSLTTRMLEKSILESAGYEVEVATSGEEGLQKAGARRYGAMIVDVEMPGIDGFEVLSRAGRDPALRDIPVVLMTSRNAPDDLRRGKELGARAYIVKNEFDQRRLLSILSGLL